MVITNPRGLFKNFFSASRLSSGIFTTNFNEKIHPLGNQDMKENYFCHEKIFLIEDLRSTEDKFNQSCYFVQLYLLLIYHLMTP
jgi:hypothetical protein